MSRGRAEHARCGVLESPNSTTNGAPRVLASHALIAPARRASFWFELLGRGREPVLLLVADTDVAGDELVEPGRPLSFGQIRDSNSYTPFGSIRDAGASPLMVNEMPLYADASIIAYGFPE